MASFPSRIGLRLIVMFLLFYHTQAQRSAQRKEELIQDTVRKFLGVKIDERTSIPGKPQSLPPRYMMDLYEKYRSGQTPMQGNTVRSILAMRDKINDVDMLIFNLTGLKSSEQILQSKLYLLKRRKAKNGKKRERSTFRLSVACLSNATSKHQIDISLTRQKPEWHSYDISESVVSCRQCKKDGDNLLGLTLDVRRPKGSYKKTAFKRLIKPNSQPFLLIFSEDSQNQSVSSPVSASHDSYDGIGDLLRAKANEEGLLPERFRLHKNSETVPHHRHKRSNNNINYTFFKNTTSFQHEHKLSLLSAIKIPNFRSEKDILEYINAVSRTFNLHKNIRTDFVNILKHFINFTRDFLIVDKQIHNGTESDKNITKKRQLIKDNLSQSLPMAKQNYNSTNGGTSYKVLFSKLIQSLLDGYDFTQNERKRLFSSVRLKRSIADTLRYSTEGKESSDIEATMKTIEVIEEKYLQQQDSDNFPKQRRRNRKRKISESPKKHKKKRRRNRKLPFWWTRHDSKLHSQDLKHMCHRKSLMVDFSQLGWDDWIISPKTFNARYCAGSCTFPIIKHTETSNHAAVQSLIHAMGLNKDIPTPCCVPSATSSLTLLYFDEHGGLVLKSYPNMIVEKCGCR